MTLEELSVYAKTVHSVSEFIHLGSEIFTDGYSIPEMMPRITLAASAMNQLGRDLEAEKPEPYYQAPSV